MQMEENRISSERLRVIVIGLDGATFDLILPWVKEGCLPTFKRLMEEGVWGELKSTIPPLTGPAWSLFMTGKNQGKHGIFDFMVRNPEGYDWITINATFRKGRSFWNFLEEEGRRAIVFNVPVTYPPEHGKGAMVSGFLTPPGAEDFIFPPELGKKLEKEVGVFHPHYPGETYALGRGKVCPRNVANDGRHDQDDEISDEKRALGCLRRGDPESRHSSALSVEV